MLEKIYTIPINEAFDACAADRAKGCPFCARCDACMKICLTEIPEEVWINDDHKAACWVNVMEAVKEEGGSGE